MLIHDKDYFMLVLVYYTKFFKYIEIVHNLHPHDGHMDSQHGTIIPNQYHMVGYRKIR